MVFLTWRGLLCPFLAVSRTAATKQDHETFLRDTSMAASSSCLRTEVILPCVVIPVSPQLFRDNTGPWGHQGGGPGAAEGAGLGEESVRPRSGGPEGSEGPARAQPPRAGPAEAEPWEREKLNFLDNMPLVPSCRFFTPLLFKCGLIPSSRVVAFQPNTRKIWEGVSIY